MTKQQPARQKTQGSAHKAHRREKEFFAEASRRDGALKTKHEALTAN